MGRNKPSSCLQLLLLLLTYVIPFFLQAYVSYSQITTTCNSVDLKALEDFANGIENGTIVGWGLNASSSSSNCCNWVGVTCDPPSSSRGRVIGLNFSSMGLKGSLPSSLSDMYYLKTLVLSNNFLAGAVPSSIFHLPKLEILDLSRNIFTGTIPTNSSLPSLRELNVSYNSFNGSLPVFTEWTNLTSIDISSNKFSGPINASNICTSSPKLRTLCLSGNLFSGELPVGFAKCRSLRELKISASGVSGPLPEDLFELSSLTQLNLQNNRLYGNLSSKISNLSNLVQLDLSMNNFSGLLPDVFGTMRKLQVFSVQSNKFRGYLPSSLSELSSARVLNLRNNSFSGEITLNFSSLPRLLSIDLGSNQFSGYIPEGLSACVELKSLNLARNYLSGPIPKTFRDLQALNFLSLSNNSLSDLASSLEVIQNCSSLTGLVLTLNFRGETMPLERIMGFKKLQLLVIASCQLSGSIPAWLAGCSQLQLVDMSWNKLDGTIPSWFGDFNSLFYLDLSNNSFTGEIPFSLTNLTALQFDNSSLTGLPPANIPFFSKRSTPAGLQYNQLNSFPPSLILNNNRLNGSIWPQFGNLKKLHVMDLSMNNLTGIIPEELSGMTSLEILDLSHNGLTGSIPASLNKLSFLSKFSVAFNHLVGQIPVGPQFSTFTNTSFEGNADLCGVQFIPCRYQNPIEESGSSRKMKKNAIIAMALGISCSMALVLALILIVLSRTHCRRVKDAEKVAAVSDDHTDFSGSSLVLLFQNKDSKEITIDDITKSTNNFDQANIIGCGGFGLVYKATLPDGRKVAIKRLSGDFWQMEREFQAEVEALSSAQHQNLVMLQGYCRIESSRLLIYSFMENGSLDYWLHEKPDGKSMLNWDTRLRIAQGAAKGLVYLHQCCEPHILHRDIKTSNILLDESFEAHLADFGLARLMEPYATHVTTDLIGTLGYIPPEYGQSSVATFKGDIYSFGVVLMELLTGRRPMDICRPNESRDLVSWVFRMKKEKREAEVFDHFIYDKQNDKQFMQALDVACRCISQNPKDRPSTEEIVSLLGEIETAK